LDTASDNLGRGKHLIEIFFRVGRTRVRLIANLNSPGITGEKFLKGPFVVSIAKALPSSKSKQTSRKNGHALQKSSELIHAPLSLIYLQE
jgi:hypothetical protein